MRSPLAGLAVFLKVGAACSESNGPSSTLRPASLALGQGHVCQISAGSTSCWGAGSIGQLGIGALPADTTPSALDGIPAFVSIAAGQSHTCAVDADGAAWCWGSNSHGELGTGTLADERCGSLPCQTRPARVATNERFRSLTTGAWFTCGLATSGSVSCWGANDASQLGNDATGDNCEGLPCSRTPVVAAGGATFTDLSAARASTCALDQDGSVWCWGLDVMTHRFSDQPARLSSDVKFIRLAAGGLHTCALTSDHAAWCWGIDALGAGAATLDSDHPVPVTGAHEFKLLASGRFTTCGVDQAGVAWCWGANSDGAAGNEPVGAGTRFEDPVQVSGSLRFTAIAAGATTYCGVTTTGSTACWGRGVEGQLVNGHQSSTVPVVIGGGRLDG
jgi:alpha-tubulin suppressor-like RCC1 family protein